MLDTRVVESPARDLVAYGEVTARNPQRWIDAWIRVHPELTEEGIAPALLAWTERRAVERAPGATTLLWQGTSALARGVVDLLLANGYRHIRTFWHMQVPLDVVPPPGEPPDGIRIRRYVEGQDDRAIHAAEDEAFRDHFGFEPVDEAEFWREWREFEPYDPTLMLVAEEGDGSVVGICLNFIDEGVGWVGEIGVRRAWRNRGIATAMLARSFAEFASRGARMAQLNVDSANESGAIRLYERVGMSVRREYRVLEKRVEASSGR